LIIYTHICEALCLIFYDAVISKAGENVFLKFNNKSGIEHIKAAEELGLGVQKYEIVEI